MAQQGSGSDEDEARNHSAALDAFPELWAEVLKRVPEADRLRHVPLVSRRFSKACRDPSLWPELRVLYAFFRTKARWRSFLRWLAMRGSGLQTLVFSNEREWDDRGAAVWEERTLELVALLAASAPQLRSLEYWYPRDASWNPASALPTELGRLSQLTSLTLGLRSVQVTAAQVDAMVQTLPSLQHLSLDGDHLLSDGFPVSITSVCSQLMCLEIRGAEIETVPPELGRLTSLTRLDLRQTEIRSLPDSISRLSRLAELDLRGYDDTDLPPGLAACRQLTRLEMGSDAASPVLASLQSLRHLSVRASQQPHEPHWTQLTALTELQLDCLQRVSFPAGLGGMTSLRKLSIRDSAGDDLPGGPYLSRLESLALEECFFPEGVPAVLAAASHLRHLCFSSVFPNRRWMLTAVDVAVLSSLPALAKLTMQQPRGVGNNEWAQRLAQLRAAFAAKARAPPNIYVCL